jgi:predicted DNA-binding transcriptional regulator AlpA
MERLLEVDEVAAKLRVSRSMLNKARVTGDGPPFIKIGSRVLYDERDLEKFITDSRLRSTSARAKGAA